MINPSKTKMNAELTDQSFAFLDAEIAALGWHDLTCPQVDAQTVEAIAARAMHEHKAKQLINFVFIGAAPSFADLLAGLLGGQASSDSLDYRL